MKSVMQQQITNKTTIDGAAAAQNARERLNRRHKIASRAVFVASLSLLIGIVLGCIGTADARVPGRLSMRAGGRCDPNIGFTIKSGGFIKGSGSLPCRGSATVTLQRKFLRTWGSDLKTIHLNGAGDSRSVVWNCRGKGKQTYRTIITWRTLDGKPGFKESNHLEVSCK